MHANAARLGGRRGRPTRTHRWNPADTPSQLVKPGAKDIPIFWGHGKDDPVVEYECECAERSRCLSTATSSFFLSLFFFPTHPHCLTPLVARSPIST